MTQFVQHLIDFGFVFRGVGGLCLRLTTEEGCDIVHTVLADLKSFQQCAAQQQKANAVILWCPQMLAALDRDPQAKSEFIGQWGQANSSQ